MKPTKAPLTQEARFKRQSELGTIEAAVGWERAFLVAIDVRLNASTGHPTKSIDTTIYTLSTYEYAALGFNGLKTHVTVRAYVERWLAWKSGLIEHDEEGNRTYDSSLIDLTNEDLYPKPGDTFDPPNVDWPPEKRNLGSRTSTDPVKAISDLIDRDGPEAVAEAIVTANQGVAEAVEDKVLTAKVQSILSDDNVKGGLDDTEPAAAFDNQGATDIVIDAAKAVGRVEIDTDLLGHAIRDNRAAFDDLLVERIARLADRMAILTQSLHGVSDADLERLLEESQ